MGTTRISLSSLTVKSMFLFFKQVCNVITEVILRAARIAPNYVDKAFAAPHGL